MRPRPRWGDVLKERHRSLEGPASTSPGGKDASVSSYFLRTELRRPILGAEKQLKKPSQTQVERGLKTNVGRIRRCFTDQPCRGGRPGFPRESMSHPEKWGHPHVCLSAPGARRGAEALTRVGHLTSRVQGRLMPQAGWLGWPQPSWRRVGLGLEKAGGVPSWGQTEDSTWKSRCLKNSPKHNQPWKNL